MYEQNKKESNDEELDYSSAVKIVLLGKSEEEEYKEWLTDSKFTKYFSL